MIGTRKIGADIPRTFDQPMSYVQQPHYVHPTQHSTNRAYLPYQDRRQPHELQYFPVASSPAYVSRGMNTSYWQYPEATGYMYDDYTPSSMRLAYPPTASASPHYVYTSPHQPLAPIIYKAGHGEVTYAPHPSHATSAYLGGPVADSWTMNSYYNAPHQGTASVITRPSATMQMAPGVSPTHEATATTARGRTWARKKKALTYSQCEILNSGTSEEDGPQRQSSLQLAAARGASELHGDPRPLRSASVTGAHRVVSPAALRYMTRPEQSMSPNIMPPLQSPHFTNAVQPFSPHESQEDGATDPSPSTSASPSAPVQFDGTVTSLEQLKALNEKNLALAKNAHVRDIWKGLQDPAGSAPRLQIADVNKARETLQNLNPEIKNSEALLKLLEDHIHGRQPQITPELAQELGAAAQQIYVPVKQPANQAPAEPPQPNAVQGGFKVSHAFAMKLKQGEEREFAAVKVIESPEVLAVFGLLTPSEAEDLTRRCEGTFKPCKTSAMKIKVDEKCTSYTIPNDLEDLQAPLLDSAALSRDVEVSVLNLVELEAEPDWSFLKSVALRAAAVAKVPSHRVNSFYVEKYDPGQKALGMHPSNKRLGLVYICLSTVNQDTGGALSFPLAEIELTPKTGMAIFIPGCHSDTVPGSPEYAGDHQYVPDVRTEFCVTQNTSTEPVYFAVVPIAFD